MKEVSNEINSPLGLVVFLTNGLEEVPQVEVNPCRLEPADHFTKKLPPGDVTQPDVRLDPVGTKEILYKLEREGEREVCN